MLTLLFSSKILLSINGYFYKCTNVSSLYHYTIVTTAVTTATAIITASITMFITPFITITSITITTHQKSDVVQLRWFQYKKD